MTETAQRSQGRGAAAGMTAWLDRLLAALADPARRDRVMAALLAVYAVVWTLYGAVAKSTQDIHFDMGEALVWSREAGWGTPKHPPLSGWIAGAWFTLFPQQDWAFYLLGIALATIALWVAWKIFQRWLPGDKAAAGIAMLTFVPFYNFHALKFNANSVLIPLWALVTWAFLRSLQTRAIGWAVFAGVAAAGAMLGKYWSAVLLLALGFAALLHSGRRAYFASPAPWVTIAAGLVVLAPHLLWLSTHDFAPVTFALKTHQADVAEVFNRGLVYLGSAIAYLAVPLLLTLLIARLRPAVLADIAAPHEDDRQMIVLIFVLPIVLSLIAAFAAQSAVSPIWLIASATLAPVVLLSSPKVQIARRETARLLAAAMIAPFIALLFSPVVALEILKKSPPNDSAYYKLLAGEVERTWRETSQRPLRFIGGSTELINSVSFYVASGPATLDVAQPEVTPWANDSAIVRDGIVWVCRASDVACTKAVAARVAASGLAKQVDVDLTPRAFGQSGETRRFTIAIMPPMRAS